MKRCISLVFVLLAISAAGLSETTYRLPPQEITRIIDTAPTPEVLVSPSRDAMLLLEYETYPPISFLSLPILRLAGMRIRPQTSSRQRTRRYTGIRIQRLDGSPAWRVELPSGARIGLPLWSNDGKRFAFQRDAEDGVELWLCDAATGKATAVSNVRLNDLLGAPFAWMRDNGRLLVHVVAAGRGAAPEAARVPAGPIVQETAGKLSQMATFEDLLKDAHDEDLFQYYATAQLAIVDASSGAVTAVGKPEMFLSAEFSPDERYLMVKALKRPFSYRVPYFFFARSTEVRDASGKSVATIADLPVSDEVPRQGVPTGPRSAEWQPLRPATVVWAEALDGGDPLKKVPHRDKVMRLSAPFTASPEQVHLVTHRFTGLAWTAREDQAVVTEYDRDRRWRTASLATLAPGAAAPKVLFDLSANDAYKDPGAPVFETRPDGQRVLLQDGDWVYLAGAGATETGDRPFLDRFNLTTLEKERLFRCGENAYEQFVSFSGGSRGSVLIRSESKSDPPNVFLLDIKAGKRRRPDGLPRHRSGGNPDRQAARPLYPKRWRRALRNPLSPARLQGGHAPAPAHLGIPARVLRRRHGRPGAWLDAQLYAALRRVPRLLRSPRLRRPERRHDAGRRRPGDGQQHLHRADHRLRAGRDRKARLHGRDRSQTRLRRGAQLRRLHDGEPARAQRPLRRGHREERGLQPLADSIRLPDGAPLLLGGDRPLHEDLALHTRQQDQEAAPLDPRRSGRQLRDLPDPVRAPLRSDPRQRWHGAPRAPNEAHGYRARESILHTLAEMLDWADRYVKNPGGALAAVK